MTGNDKANGCAWAVLGSGAFVAVLVVLLIGSGIGVGDGHRDGTVQKFARKGLAIRTWEGELAMEGIRTKGESIGNVLAFSVEDDSVAAQIDALPPGAKVRVFYRETLCRRPFGRDTGYVVTRVERAE